MLKFISFLGSLSNIQKLLGVLVLVGSSITGIIAWHQNQLDEAYNTGYDKAKLEIETQYNLTIIEQQNKHQQEVTELLNEHAAEVELAIQAVDQYWQDFYEKKEATLVANYEKKLEAERIKNEADTITDKLSPDTVRLLKQAFDNISPPTYYKQKTRTP